MTLPPCHSRHPVPGADAVFFCAHPRVHAADQLVTAGVCRLCPYWQQPAPAAPRPVPAAHFRRAGRSCSHLGDQVGERPCTGCRGAVRVKLFACRHPRHRETTLAECATCADFAPRAEASPEAADQGAEVR